MKNLREMIGQEILAHVPLIDRGKFQMLRLHGIEDGGIWVESELLTQSLLTKLNVPSSKTPIFFLPYHQIQFLMQAIEKLALSEKSLGL